MRTRRQILDYLFSLHRRGRIKYDLERIREAAARIGNPQAAYRSVHVAGTNGKGSVCSMVEAVLRRSGRRTGLFIKPHLIEFEERFLVDGSPVTSEEWLDIYASIEPKIKDLTLTFFEICALVAFEVFRRAAVEWAVFETGMGGRLDATNVVVPRVSGITAISLDHTDWLGNTLVDIAREKLGIVKPGVPVVMIEPGDAGVRAAAEEVCAQREAPLVFVGESWAEDITEDGEGVRFRHDGQAYRVPLVGRHQALNALCAAEIARKAGITEPEELADGIGSVRIPGRFQVVRHGDRTVVFDIAHNPEAAQSLARSLVMRFGERAVCLVVGMMKDKDLDGILQALAPAAARIVVTQPDIPRACPAADLAARARLVHDRVEEVSRVVEAVEHALQTEEQAACIAGSFYTVGEAMQTLDIKPYA
ncbi:MAG: bifunctional folylpolyglutamate synthase/dihydrofolate synthase [Chitinivibrionales bacterium]|nr:bifunctional folylpolyglutamate synthase/dihydrofolate synthase [Chitinivibrionales bacterium]